MSQGTERPAVVALMGPTASGKSALGLALAEALGGEIVSADSAQVYRGVDIGAAKPSREERARAPHHLIDVRDLGEDFSLGDFVREAGEAIRGILARGRLPILVGGTGLYLRGLLEGYTLSAGPSDPACRAAVQALGERALREELARLDPVTAGRLEPGNRRRWERALEVCWQTGRPFSELGGRGPAPYRALKLALIPPGARLRERIDRRVEGMLAQGWVEEVRGLVEKGHAPCLRRLRVLGYPDLVEVLEGGLALDEAASRIRAATWRYARRQRTWLRSEPGIRALQAEEGEALLQEARRAVAEHLEGGAGQAPGAGPTRPSGGAPGSAGDEVSERA